MRGTAQVRLKRYGKIYLQNSVNIIKTNIDKVRY